jgi:hypothetical protein
MPEVTSLNNKFIDEMTSGRKGTVKNDLERKRFGFFPFHLLFFSHGLSLDCVAVTKKGDDLFIIPCQNEIKVYRAFTGS